MHPLHLIAWIIALAWIARTLGAIRGIPKIPNLLLSRFDIAPPGDPTITVIVPARNEAPDIAATLLSLLAQDYPRLHIIAINDRSTDTTGAIMQQLAAANPARLEVITVTELPAQWLGKTHAMATAATLAIAQHNPAWLLFTDADILFRPDAIRRALAGAVVIGADHLVLFPTAIIRRWDEAAFLSFFQLMGFWSTRPWLSARNRSERDAVGIGAFNLVRTSAYLHIGGFESLRMEIVEDIGLARRILRFGLNQRAAFGRDLVRNHWAAGVPGMINVVTKNMFAVHRFNPALVFSSTLALALVCIAPFIAIFIPGYTLPAALTIAAFFLGYLLLSSRSGLPAWNAFFIPIAATVFIYALLRSMIITLHQGGVIWRGTFYSLRDLRRTNHKGSSS